MCTLCVRNHNNQQYPPGPFPAAAAAALSSAALVAAATSLKGGTADAKAAAGVVGEMAGCCCMQDIQFSESGVRPAVLGVNWEGVLGTRLASDERFSSCFAFASHRLGLDDAPWGCCGSTGRGCVVTMMKSLSVCFVGVACPKTRLLVQLWIHECT